MLKYFFLKYSIYVATLMIAQVILFLIMPFFNFNLYEWTRSKSEGAFNFLSAFMFYIFFFSVVNILVIGGSGVYFLFWKKDYKIALLCIIAAIAYFCYALQVGRDF